MIDFCFWNVYSIKQIRTFTLRFFLTLLFLLPLILKGAEPDFYIWNRQQGEDVQKVVREYYKSSTGKLYFLAGELDNDGRVYASGPQAYMELARSVPVIRIHIRNMKKNVSVLAKELVRLYQPWHAAGELQIDLDAPESKIAYYRELMKELRRQLPGVKLSATVLPCHVKHRKEFRTLAEACDFYVLQVHGLIKEGDRWYILKKEIARTALAHAKALKLPFRVALPLYCHHTDNGKTVKPDLAFVSELAKESPGVIGFRLGGSGDECVMDLKNALQICRGKGYAPKVELRWKKQKNGAWHLFVFNDGYFSEDITFRCSWKKPPQHYFRGVFHRAQFRDAMSVLALRLPPSGERKPYFWLRTGSKNPAEDVTIMISDRKVGE